MEVVTQNLNSIVKNFYSFPPYIDSVMLLTPSCCSELSLIPPTCEGLPPTTWWDAEADKSLLVGTFKHGFERYNMMRLDPALCFLSKCGPPDNAAVQVRIQKTEISALSPLTEVA